jgi:hypothetical protein
MKLSMYVQSATVRVVKRRIGNWGVAFKVGSRPPLYFECGHQKTAQGYAKRLLHWRGTKDLPRPDFDYHVPHHIQEIISF